MAAGFLAVTALLSLDLFGADVQVPGMARSDGGSEFQQNSHIRLLYNERTQRLEARNQSGDLLEEMNAGTAGQKLNVAEQEYLISFGKDERDRPSVILRPGPTMRKPVSVEVFGKRAVLSPQASLFICLLPDHQIQAEASLSGQVELLEDSGKEDSR